MTSNRFFAEAVGTFALVFVGCGAVVVNDLYGGALGHLGVNIVFGLIVMAVIYATGNISGAHINPAVTIAFWAAGRFPASAVPAYITAQCLGAIFAATVLWYLFPTHGTLGATIPAMPVTKTIVVEVLISFLLMFVVLNVSTGHKEKGIMAGVAVGGTVALNALFAGQLTGASMNPARSLGPALLSGNMDTMWIYVAAPIVGMYLARPACRWIQGADCCPSPYANEEA
jgi:aquaporin Z